jgi:HEPN domain-containing protein
LSFEEAEVLRERAEAFLENAKQLIHTGSYDLAAFNLEQHCQLLLKYKLLIKTGTYPRTHSLTRLATELAKLEPQTKTLLDREDNMLLLTKLEDAYIGARYLPRKYRGPEVEAMLRFVMEVFKPVVERV